MSIAIIPARGGSKRIPRKNIRQFYGIPIIARVVETLKATELFNKILVSSDDLEIISLSKSLGCIAPFIRPAELATDHASTSEVVNHAIDWLVTSGESADTKFLVAYPTAVLMKPIQIIEALDLLRPGLSDLVFAGAEFESQIQRAWWRSESGEVREVFPGMQPRRSQDLQPAYFDAGQFYWTTVDGFRENVMKDPRRRAMYEIDRLDAIDINTESDWQRAETRFRELSPGER